MTGASSVQAVGHCVGSASLMMALASGVLPDVRSAVCMQFTLHPSHVAVQPSQGRAGGRVLLGELGLTRWRRSPAGPWSRSCWISDSGGPDAGGERCSKPLCRWINAIYGCTHTHEQLDDATHARLDNMFGVGNLRPRPHGGHHEGPQGVGRGRGGQLPQPPGAPAVADPSGAGESNYIFRPEGSLRTLRWLQEANDPALYERVVLPGYAHLDALIGRDAPSTSSRSSAATSTATTAEGDGVGAGRRTDSVPAASGCEGGSDASPSSSSIATLSACRSRARSTSPGASRSDSTLASQRAESATNGRAPRRVPLEARLQLVGRGVGAAQSGVERAQVMVHGAEERCVPHHDVPAGIGAQRLVGGTRPSLVAREGSDCGRTDDGGQPQIAPVLGGAAGRGASSSSRSRAWSRLPLPASSHARSDHMLRRYPPVGGRPRSRAAGLQPAVQNLRTKV